MWEEVSSDTKLTKAVSVDGNGRMLTDICTFNYPLSDCQPVYTSDGLIRWYVTNGNEATLYSIDPFRLDSYDITTAGDINADGSCNIADAVLLQKWLLAVPNTYLPNWRAADLCKDEKLNVFDLCMLKTALLSNGK